MCISFVKFLKSIKEFHLTLNETRENLSDIKTILQGALKITEDIENVTEEVGNVVEFYAKESKKAIREQLSSTMSLEGREKLSHNDFMKTYKKTFEEEILYLIENHTSKQARTAILNIICQQEKYASELEVQFEKKAFKVFTLREVEKYLKESVSLYHRSYIDINMQSDDSFDNSSNNIRIFCDKQRIIDKLEKMIHVYCYTNIEETNTNDEFDKFCSQKSTRVKKLRQYLKSRIRLKKIGKYYKEEISFQLSVDLKKAAQNIWEIEENLGQQCNGFVEMLQQLPKERFANVLHEEYTINISDVIKRFNKRKLKSSFELAGDNNSTNSLDFQAEKKSKLWNEDIIDKNNFRCLTKENNEENNDFYFHVREKDEKVNKSRKFDHLKDVETKEIYQQTSPSFNIQEDKTTKNPELSTSSPSPTVVNSIITNDVLEEAVIIPNNDQPFPPKKRVDEFAERIFSLKNGITKSIENQVCRNVESDYKDVAFKNEGEIISEISKREPKQKSNDIVYKPKIFRKTIIIDPMIVIEDLDKIISPVWDAISKKAFNYTMKSIEDSHIIIHQAFDVAEQIEEFINNDFEESKNRKNLFTDKVLDICLSDFSRDNRFVLKKLIQNCLYSKENRMKLYQVLQKKFPDVIESVADTCVTVFKEIELNKQK